MVVRRKLLESFRKCLPKSSESFYIGPAVSVLFHSHDSIVRTFTFFPNLLAFDHANGDK